MRAVIWSQLRHRPGRALALAAGILVAATCFALLTSVATTSRARTVGTVKANVRSAYDVLVRPPGTRTAPERDRRLVEANFLSGVFGGITLKQYRQIRGLPQIEVAAPIANIGYVPVAGKVEVDVSRFLDRSAPAQLLRVRPELVAGLSKYPVPDQYVYLTRTNPIREKVGAGGVTYPDLERERTPNGSYWVCWYYNVDAAGLTGKDGSPQTSRTYDETTGSPTTPYSAKIRSKLNCQSGRNRARARIPVIYPALLAAIDPDQEDRLVGLRRAVTAGRMLDQDDKPYWHDDTEAVDGVGQRNLRVPALLVERPSLGARYTARVERLRSGDPRRLPARLGGPGARAFVDGLQGTPVGRTQVDLRTGFAFDRREDLWEAQYTASSYMTLGPVSYRRTPDGLAAQVGPRQSPDLWRDDNLGGWLAAPEENLGTQYRRVTGWQSTQCVLEGTCRGPDASRGENPWFKVVGRYDAARVRAFSQLSRVPLETYEPPEVTGADARTRARLGNRPLAPDRNLGGYVQQPPAMLITLSSAATMTHSRRRPSRQDRAPVSAIRIRVKGVTGVDKLSQARLTAAVTAIRRVAPRLDVDVTIGSSPAPQTILLPGGARVLESWTSKGVALRVLDAVDTKSAILFGLVLVVCGLFLVQAALASVRSRRTEIGTLRTLGWSTREIFCVILGELIVVGTVAGVLGSLLAGAVGATLESGTSPARAALVFPVAVALALVSGSVPAWRATRLEPLDAIRPPVVPARRARPVHSVLGMAVRNLQRTRGRTVLGASGLALAVAALTILLSVTLAFRGEVSGSVLGNAIVAQARTADYLSVALSLVLGVAGATDVLVLSQRERAGDLAVLRASGWTSREFSRLTIYEGAGLAILGGLTGSVVGLLVVGALSLDVLGAHAPALVAAGALSSVAALGLMAAALVVPIRALNRIAPAHLLAAE